MKPSSITLVLFRLARADTTPAHQLDSLGALLGIVNCRVRSPPSAPTQISSFLNRFRRHIFDRDNCVWSRGPGAEPGSGPLNYAEYLPPNRRRCTVAVFSIIVYLVAQSGSLCQITRIAEPIGTPKKPGERGLAFPAVHST